MEVPRLGIKSATAASLHHSHSNSGSKLRLWPTPQLMATLDPQPNWARPGIKPTTSWLLVRFVNHWAMTGTPALSTFIQHFTGGPSQCSKAKKRIKRRADWKGRNTDIIHRHHGLSLKKTLRRLHWKGIRGFPPVMQWVKDLALLQLWCRSQLQLGFHSWPGNFTCRECSPKKKKE